MTPTMTPPPAPPSNVVSIATAAARVGDPRDAVRRLVAAGTPIVPCATCLRSLPIKLTKKGGLYYWCARCRCMVRIMGIVGAEELMTRLADAIAVAVAALPPEAPAASGGSAA